MAMAVLNLHAPRRGSCFSPKPPPFSFVLSLSLLQLLLTVLPLYTLVPFSFAASTTALPPCSTLSDVSSCASEEVVAPCVWHADNSSVQALTLACDLARGLPSSLPATCSSSPCGLAVEMASPAATTAETAAAATATLLGRFHTQGLTLTGQWSGAAVARALLGAPGLRTLVASGVGLAALPADLLHAVPALAELHLPFNRITRLPFEFLHPVAQLATLDLVANGLHTLPSLAGANLTSLLELNLGYNALTVVPDLPLPQLTVLSLLENQLSTVPSTAFVGLPALRVLLLDRNAGLVLSPGALAPLDRLEALDLRSCELTQMPTPLPSGLVSLDVRINRIARLDGLFPAGLKTLLLDTNRLASVAPVAHLTNLSTFGAASNQLRGELVLPGTPHLRAVNLADNYLSSVILATEAPLVYLDLSHNTPLRSLQVLNGVDTLDISSTSLAFQHFDCRHLGKTHLAARHMATSSWRAADVLSECANTPRRELLDISGASGDDQLDAMNAATANYYYVLARDDTEIDGGGYLARTKENYDYVTDYYPAQMLPQLVVGDGSVSCRPTNAAASLFTKTGEFKRVAAASYYTCACIHNYHQNGGRCVPNHPFTATPAGIAVLVLVSLVSGAALMVLGAFARTRVRSMRIDLELQRGLLEDAEHEVLALKGAWELNADDVRLERRIDGGSEGAFGAVWLGDWDGVRVAVKVLHADLLELDTETVAEFEKEADFLMRARHANVVRFFGAGTMRDGAPFLVLEHVAHGSLRSILQIDDGEANRNNDRDAEPVARSALPPPVAMRRRLLADVARGMAYIHSLGQVHRDLKTANILVTQHMTAKVADFGSIRNLLLRCDASRPDSSRTRLSSRLPGAVRRASRTDAPVNMTVGVGTPLYMAPETMSTERYGPAADVWSFGVVVWETLACRTPDLLGEVGDVRGGPVLSRLLRQLESGARLQLPDASPAWAVAALTACQAADPEARPTFATLLQDLEAATEDA